jgi:hypothetical protein
VIVAVDVEDVAAHLLEQRALGHLEHLRDLHPREGGRPRTQEERRGLAVEHEVPDRRACEPAGAAELVHGAVEALAAQADVEEVQLRQLQLDDARHGLKP